MKMHASNNLINTLDEAISNKYFNNIKLIFVDIDGTLLNSTIEIPFDARREIQRIQQLGIAFAIASGRPYFAAKSIIEQLQIHGAGLFYTGAMLFDPSSDYILSKYPLATADVSLIVKLAREYGMHCELYTDYDYYQERTTEYTTYHTRYLKSAPTIINLDELVEEQEIYKVQLVVNQIDKEDLENLSVIKNRLPHLTFAAGHGADRPNILFSSIISGEACKRKGFEQLCQYHGVNAAQVMSIGDAGSDKVFLEMSGIGIAMGNAEPDVKSVADYVTDHVDANGLASVLRLVGRN